MMIFHLSHITNCWLFEIISENILDVFNNSLNLEQAPDNGQLLRLIEQLFKIDVSIHLSF